MLLYPRRGRACADKEIAETKLEQAQKKFKDIPTAEAYLEDCRIRFESISDMARKGKNTIRIYIQYVIWLDNFVGRILIVISD